ncbi:MAG: hypothetical protein ABII09_01965 [Planctomycetota bacterium]
MARTMILAVMMVILISFTIAVAVNEPNESNEIQSQGIERAPVARRQRIEAVTMADFYMRDGNSVSGRMLSNDNTQIVIEQPLDSTLVTRTYSKREIDPRTLKTRPVPEYRYYTQMAEYFSARTWDFRDDPDDFIAAIRSYEKAKQSLQQGGGDEERISEIDKALKKIEEDRVVWTREVESRAKLKKLEYEAEAENRLKQLEKQVAESNIKLNESIKYLDKRATEISSDYQRLENTISGLNKDLVEQIRNLQLQIQENRAFINDLYNRLYFVNRAPAGGR